jgi:nucleoside-diphosphate-sugar epimerase
MSKFLRAAKRNQNITIYGDGSQTRTFCYIDDNIETTLKCIEEDAFVNDVINLGNDKQITILELANLIIDKTGSKSEIVHLPPLPEGDMSRRQPDIQKMKQLLNRELLPLDQGIDKLLATDLFD